jgi:hypothetical protein
MTPTALIREKPVNPMAEKKPEPKQRGGHPIVTRAEVARCTCPERCERDHERD